MKWGFEEADDWEDLEPDGHSGADPEFEETLVGRDTDQVVEVVVSPEAEPVAVRLSPDWNKSVDPRVLHSSVLTAANNATMQALARSVEQVKLAGAPLPPSPTGTDESPLNAVDVRRLLDAVSVELDRYAEQLQAVVDREVHAESAGGHVTGVAQRGQILSLDIDGNWAVQARHTEIESELIDVLRKLRESTTPRELAAGPSGTAISELMELAADPPRLMRRLGMPE